MNKSNMSVIMDDYDCLFSKTKLRPDILCIGAKSRTSYLGNAG